MRGGKAVSKHSRSPLQSTHPAPASTRASTVCQAVGALQAAEPNKDAVLCPESLEMAMAKALGSHLAYTASIVLLTHTRHLSFHYSLCSQCTVLLLSHRPAQSGLQDSSLWHPQTWMLWSSWALKIYSVPDEENKLIFIIKQHTSPLQEN